MSSAGSRPDFSGSWQTTGMRVTIEHREPVLVQHLIAGDRSQTFHVEVGTELVNTVNGIPVRTCARWEASELVIESWMKMPDREMHFKDHWSITDDGSTLTMAHRDDDLAGQTTVLQRGE